MKIMFVDDERRILDGIEMMLFDHVEDWELSFYESGYHALEHLARETVDVIVSDMRMPGMNGEELLRLVKERHPEVIRIVLSGQVEAEVAERILLNVHDFLSKPTEAGQLIGTIQRALGLARSPRPEELKRLVGNLDGLPPRPTTYLKLRAAITDPECGLNDLAEILDHDIAMSATVLHLANSAYFARGYRADKVIDAVNRLGADIVAAVALSAEALSSFTAPGIDLESLNEHALHSVGIIGAAVPQPRHVELEAAALHPIGSLLIASALPDRYRSAQQLARASGISVAAAEQELFGFTHAHAGAYLLRLWNLDPTVPEAIDHMHCPWATSGDARRAAAAIWACHVVAGQPDTMTRPDPLPDDIAQTLESVRRRIEHAA
jgi:HD-like signal output (HDOD) protein/CheY-like chemotaxis protein